MTPKELPEELRAELAQITAEVRRVWGNGHAASLVQHRTGWRTCVLADFGSIVDGTYCVRDTLEQAVSDLRVAVRRQTRAAERSEAQRITAHLSMRNLGATVNVSVSKLADRSTCITSRVTGEGWEERVRVTGASFPKTVDTFWCRLRAR